MATKRASFLALALVASMAYGQFDFGGGQSGPSKPVWEEFKLPKKSMKLDFRNSSIDLVLELFMKTSGVTIIKDPTLTGPISLTTAKQVPLKDAFAALNAMLTLKNFEMKKEGNMLVIKAKPVQRGGGRDGGMGSTGGMQIDPSMFSGMQQQSTVLRVYPIKYASASAVSKVINDVFLQQQQANMGFNPMMMMMGGRGGRTNFGRGGMNFGGFGGSTGPSVRASADDYSNSVIVNAPSKEQTQVDELIKQIDKQTDTPLKAQVYKVNYATAADLQPVVQNLLISNTPTGRGQSSNQPVDRQFSFFPMMGGGNNNRQQQAMVSVDNRSNSLVVTTTETNQVLVGQVLKELDTKITMESTTFVVPLDNAQAATVAGLMQQAFGNRNNRGMGGGTTRTNTGRTGTNTRTNTGRTGGGGGGLQGIGGNAGEEIALELDDPNLNAGDLQTNIAVQGGFFGFGQQQQQNQQRPNQAQLGRDAQGRLVPIQDLTNQVTIIPDPNTNSVIVVTNPENADMIRQILSQLDRIPEQVMIETIIVEASLDATSKMGVEWKFNQTPAFNNPGTTGTLDTKFNLPTSSEGLRYTLTGGNLNAFLNMMQSDTKFEVLSTPRIFTSNNAQAQINISQRVPFVVSQRTDANGNITYNYDFEDVGIVLTVTPRITANGYVTMDVSQTANDLQGFTDFNAPIVNQRQADTTVAVKDGDTIVLGGIIRSSVSTTTKKIPLLGDIPFFGNLFKSTSKEKQKTELLVFLTPHVVRNPDDASKLRKELQNTLSPQTQKGLKEVIKPGQEPPKVDPPKKDGGR